MNTPQPAPTPAPAPAPSPLAWTIRSATLTGNGTVAADVRVTCNVDDTKRGGMEIAGLPESMVRDVAERIRSTKSKRFGWNVNRVRFNVEADGGAVIRSAETVSLAMLVALLIEDGSVTPSAGLDLGNTIFIGSLSLSDDRFHTFRGGVVFGQHAAKAGCTLVVADDRDMFASAEAAIAEIGCKVEVVTSVDDLARYISGKLMSETELFSRRMLTVISVAKLGNAPNRYPYSSITPSPSVDLAVRVAVAGSHPTLIIGEPGTGKAMLARRLTSIMPDMTVSQMLETITMRSAAALLGDVTRHEVCRPFRAPHHTATAASLTNSNNGRPCELDLAKHGVILFDEAAELSRVQLEAIEYAMKHHPDVLFVFAITPSDVTIVPDKIRRLEAMTDITIRLGTSDVTPRKWLASDDSDIRRTVSEARERIAARSEWLRKRVDIIKSAGEPRTRGNAASMARLVTTIASLRTADGTFDVSDAAIADELSVSLFKHTKEGA